MNSNLPAPIITKHDRFLVLRDDLLDGGTKKRALYKIVSTIPNDECVYAAHAFGYAGYALALACLECNKKVRLFYPGPMPSIDNEIFQKTIRLPNVVYHIVETYTKQSELVFIAQNYSKENNAYFFPIGFNMHVFSQELQKVALSLNFIPKEVWVLGGSGTLSGALRKARPDVYLNVVNLGMAHGNMEYASRVYNAPEKPEEEAQFLPPYHSSIYYDAKIRRFVEKYGSDNALIRNVA